MKGKTEIFVLVGFTLATNPQNPKAKWPRNVRLLSSTQVKEFKAEKGELVKQVIVHKGLGNLYDRDIARFLKPQMSLVDRLDGPRILLSRLFAPLCDVKAAVDLLMEQTAPRIQYASAVESYLNGNRIRGSSTR